MSKLVLRKNLKVILLVVIFILLAMIGRYCYVVYKVNNNEGLFESEVKMINSDMI